MLIARISFQSAKMNRRTERTRSSTQSKKPAAKKIETKVEMPARMTIATTHEVSNLPRQSLPHLSEVPIPASTAARENKR